MKYVSYGVVCALSLLVSQVCSWGGETWSPALKGKKSITSANTVGVVSGETLLGEDHGVAVMTFQADRTPASFRSEGILDARSGALEISFKPTFEKQPKSLQCNHLFVSNPYLMGYNIDPKGHAVYFLTRTSTGKPAGVYAKATLTSGTWHRLRAEWRHRQVSLYLDGTLLTTSGQGDSPFDKTFRLGASGWEHSRCLIREVSISSGESSAAASAGSKPQQPVWMPTYRKAPVTQIRVPENLPFPGPFCSVGEGNLLENGDFSQLETLPGGTVSGYRSAQMVLNTPSFPVDWHLNLNHMTPPWTRGSYGVTPMTRADGKPGHTVTLNMPENKWNNVFFQSAQRIPWERLEQGGFRAGVWARGKGTLRLLVQEFAKGNRIATGTTAVLVTDQWKFYRTEVLRKRNQASDGVGLALAVYGQVEFALPEIAREASVDSSAELTFYAPFDKGSAEAFFSVGNAGVQGPGEATQGVPGKVGGAYRLDRQRRMTPMGFLRYPMGLTYECMERVLDKESGTLELWLKPLPEMAVKQAWEPFYVFKIGSGHWRWRNGEDFEVFIRREKDGQLSLVVTEHVKMKEWPTRKPVPNEPREVLKTYSLGKPEALIGRWFHLAFTYDEKERVLWLDGQPVIRFDALKAPALMENGTLVFGCSHLTAPFLSSCDVDEFRIYRGVKYRKPFTPAAVSLAFQQQEIGPAPVAHARRSGFAIGQGRVAEDGRAMVVPLSYGGRDYELRLSLADGYPLIFSSKDAAMEVQAHHHPDLPELVLEHVQLGKGVITGQVPRRDTQVTWRVTETKGSLRVTLELNKPEGFWRAYLEPRVSVRAKGGWERHYDGFAERPVLLPFRSFGFDSQMIALPLSACWRGEEGLLLGLAPETIVSYLWRGMTAPDSVSMSLRTVLDKGDRMSYEVEVIPFNARYGTDSAVEAYQQRHPDIFRRNPQVDPRNYGNIGITNIWQTAETPKRMRKFSLMEINRRMRGHWCWHYCSGTSTGNWEPDMEMLRELAPINVPQIANADYHANWFKGGGYASYEKRDMTPAVYISAWMEKRFVPYFNDSVFDDVEVSSGINTLHGYWWVGIRDYVGIQTGTTYGTWLRNQIQGIFDHFPTVSTFAHDEMIGDYFFRKPTTMGGARAFDEQGAYTHNMAAMGAFLRDVLATKNQTGYKTAVIGNARIQSSGYNCFFRAANNIYERPIHWSLQDWTTLRQHARMMGEKPNTFYPHHAIVGNYFKPDTDDPRLMRYFLVGYNRQQMLAGLLFNVQMNYTILGVKETVEDLDELDRAHGLGYRQVAAAKTSPGIGLVRYGEPGYGLFGLVNASPEPRQASLEVDSDYLNGTPLLAANGQQLKVTAGKAVFEAVKPLSWQLVEMVVGVQGSQKLSYTSTLTAGADRRECSVVFQQPATLKGLTVGLYPHEDMTAMTLNGKNISRHRTGNLLVATADLQVKAGDTLKLVTWNQRWQSPVKDILAVPYLKDRNLEIVCANEETDIQGKRIAEFFRFWTVNQPDGKEYTPGIMKQATDVKARVRIVLENAGTPGLSCQGQTVRLKGRGRELSDVVDLFLAQLDKRYPYYGFYGEQTPMLPWDYTTTPEQKRLQDAAGVIGKTLTAEQALREFWEWKRETK